VMELGYNEAGGASGQRQRDQRLGPWKRIGGSAKGISDGDPGNRVPVVRVGDWTALLSAGSVLAVRASGISSSRPLEEQRKSVGRKSEPPKEPPRARLRCSTESSRGECI
jgi:hypothetical protein